MRQALTALWTLVWLGALLAPFQARAGQQVYLSTSPDGKYRVVVEQVIDRRVGGDHIFFRYPISLVDAKTLRHFVIREGVPPLIKESDRETFTPQWDSIKFNWAPDNQKLFINMEILEGSWRTYFVDIKLGKTLDVTADLESNLFDRIKSHGWSCQSATITPVQWIKPHLAFLKVATDCGKNTDRENNHLFTVSDSVLYDTVKQKVVSDCSDCDDPDSTKKFEKYFMKIQVTPTPTPDETPTAQ
jgi:hypothetical protein